MTESQDRVHEIRIKGIPNERQRLFFASRTRFTAYGGARGGGKSWALRRKLVAMCLRYSGIRCLLIRRTYDELKSNHVIPFLREYGALMEYSEGNKSLNFSNGSKIFLGYCSCDRDVLRYQGQEYDVIAVDEATQLSEYQFSIFKACLRGVENFPRRMYLTCNPGGIGHAWVKRLFVDRDFRSNEDPYDYSFIPAQVFDNEVLCRADPNYVGALESLPPKLRDAWLYGKWDVFEGQFFTEFDPDKHICSPNYIPQDCKNFVAFDYGFDMLAVLLMSIDREGTLYCKKELCVSGLTLSDAAEAISEFCKGERVEYAVASPDLWNRRQDTGRSGFEIMQSVSGMPPMVAADDRRVAGWRVLREYLGGHNGKPKLYISSTCVELTRCLPALICDPLRAEDVSNEPHSITHAPEALRYAVMSRIQADIPEEKMPFTFPTKKIKSSLFFD